MVSESAEWLVVAAARWCVRRSSPDREHPDALEHGPTFSGVPTLNVSLEKGKLEPQKWNQDSAPKLNNREDGSQILVGGRIGDINLQLLGIYDGSDKTLNLGEKHVYLRWI